MRPRTDRPPVLLDPGGEARFPPPDALGDGELLALGGALSPEWLLAAYRAGAFVCGRKLGLPLWWSPPERAVLDPARLRVSRRLARRLRTASFGFTVDRAFAQVVRRCARPGRPGGWIEPGLEDAFLELHRRGAAHSFEVWVEGELVGGLFGVRVGGFFSAESMFHTRPDASKAAVVRAVESLHGDGVRLVDAQWPTPHLLSLGATVLPRARYLDRLARALTGPQR